MNTCLSFSGACAFSLFAALSGTAASLDTTSEYSLPWQQKPCPTISVSCPPSSEPGEAITFKADIVGGSSDVVPEYSWTISAGTIVEGQGTPTIKVDTRGTGGQALTASVDVAGLMSVCKHQASCSMIPYEGLPVATLFDRYYPKPTGAAAPTRTHRRRKIRTH
jgi:hypothetical protein